MIELSLKEQENIILKGFTKEALEELLDSDDIDFYLDFLLLQGLNLSYTEGKYSPKQLPLAIDQAIFCILDIETNGGDPQKHQIIEVGALLVQNGQVLKEFDSLIHTDKLPDAISKLTGITLNDLKTAPSLKEIMPRFREFIADAIIVAHPLKFDYTFVSSNFEKIGLASMLNLGICNIALAERTLSSAKYGLHYLNKTLKFDEDFKQHRALNDAIITKNIFLKALENLPENINTVFDLLRFIKEGKKQPRAALIK